MCACECAFCLRMHVSLCPYVRTRIHALRVRKCTFELQSARPHENAICVRAIGNTHGMNAARVYARLQIHTTLHVHVGIQIRCQRMFVGYCARTRTHRKVQVPTRTRTPSRTHATPHPTTSTRACACADVRVGAHITPDARRCTTRDARAGITPKAHARALAYSR
jgi:hypothetical protein